MSEYHCDICDKTLSNKYWYNKHLKTDLHKYKADPCLKKEYPCICGKKYSCIQSRHSHRSKCKLYTESLQNSVSTVNNNDIVVELQAKVVELEKQLLEKNNKMTELEKELIKKNAENEVYKSLSMVNHTTNTNSHNTNNIDHFENNNNIQIKLNTFGKENLDYLNNSTVIPCINEVFNSVVALNELIYFSPEHPENHNIQIPNKKDKYVKVVGQNKNWIYLLRSYAINKMKYKSIQLLEKFFYKNIEKFTAGKQKKFDNFLEKFHTNDPTTHKNIVKDLEVLILNQGQML